MNAFIMSIHEEEQEKAAYLQRNNKSFVWIIRVIQSENERDVTYFALTFCIYSSSFMLIIKWLSFFFY